MYTVDENSRGIWIGWFGDAESVPRVNAAVDENDVRHDIRQIQSAVQSVGALHSGFYCLQKSEKAT